MEIYNSSCVKSADEDQREVDEWLKKVEKLEKQYQDELSGSDDKKKDEAIKRIANEAGMPPRLAVGIMNRPIISQINYYFMNAKKAEPASSHTSSDSWTCKMCGTDNDGNFCKVCGAKRP